MALAAAASLEPLKNLPTTWGLRHNDILVIDNSLSEKPPHHMGIKTLWFIPEARAWEYSEKPPHHMGIKTIGFAVLPFFVGL